MYSCHVIRTVYFKIPGLRLAADNVDYLWAVREPCILVAEKDISLWLPELPLQLWAQWVTSRTSFCKNNG